MAILALVTAQPSVFPFGIRIDEPVTTATDLLVSAVCFYAFYGVQKQLEASTFKTYCKYYFLSMGFATFIGGVIGHAFLYALSFAWKLPGWVTSMLAITLLERAVILKTKHHLSSGLYKLFGVLNIAELLLFLILSFTTLNFLWVEVHSAYGLLVVVGSLSFYIYRKSKNLGARYYLIAVAFSAIAAFTFTIKWSPHLWFNYLDLSHVIMALAAWYFYLGTLKFSAD